MRPPFSQGQAVPLQYMVSTQYHSLGVLFNSAGGGIRISAPPNPVSAPNVAGATDPGPVVSYTASIGATFFLSGSPAVADVVQLTLTSSSSSSALSAYDPN